MVIYSSFLAKVDECVILLIGKAEYKQANLAVKVQTLLRDYEVAASDPIMRYCVGFILVSWLVIKFSEGM